MKQTAAQLQSARALAAVSDPARRSILRLLKQRGCCALGKAVGMCACDVEARMQLSQPTISHHMRVLAVAGLVRAEKLGKWMWYRRDEAGLKRLRRWLEQEL